MTVRSTRHGAFALDRVLRHPIERVFNSWSTAEAKAHWFMGPPGQWTALERNLDFRIGGREKALGQFASGMKSLFQAYYYDIVPNERIVYSYDMHLDATLISVSVATITFQAQGNRTLLTINEQGVFLDAFDDGGSREQGTAQLLLQLEAALDK
jgi:uncharacterized protein YndB with AHSA1/START domain